MGLNEQQQWVARARPGVPLKVVAGAGTGKTETLAARFVELVRGGISPASILLLTFTEEAAAEMRDRVLRRLRTAEPELPPAALLNLWCHTFHGFAMRLVRETGWAVGLPPTPRLLDDADQQARLDAIVGRWEDEDGSAGFHPLEHTSYRWEDGEAWRNALRILGSLRDSAAGPDQLDPAPELRDQQLSLYAEQRAQLVPLIEHAYAAYTTGLQDAGLLDYDELIMVACRMIAEMPAIADRFTVVMVDEFQDTNPAQLALLSHLGRDWSSMTVVGDPRQAIYGWRSARAESLREFPYSSDPAAEHTLAANYRSRRAICAVANYALAGSSLYRMPHLVPARTEPPAHPVLLEGPEVSLVVLPAIDDEARVVAREISRLLLAGVPASDIVLLMRARTHLTTFTAALHAAGVPYTLTGGKGFYAEAAVRLVASLLQCLIDPEERAAAVHVLESPLIGLPVDLLRIPQGSAAIPAWWHWLLAPEAVPENLPERELIVPRLQRFQAFATAARHRMTMVAPGDFLPWLWVESGLQEWCHASGDQQGLRDLQKLVVLADTWSVLHPGLTVAGFTDRLRKRVAGLEPGGDREAIPVVQSLSAVEVTTVHGAKGREWPVVFFADTALPSVRSASLEHVFWDEQWKLVIGDGKVGSKRGGPNPTADARETLRRRAREEERAIWYVGLTRARDRLVVTHSRCPLDAAGHFEDVPGPWGEGASPEDARVHFFHQLWEIVRAQSDELGNAVTWGPGPCSGAPDTDQEDRPMGKGSEYFSVGSSTSTSS